MIIKFIDIIVGKRKYKTMRHNNLELLGKTFYTLLFREVYSFDKILSILIYIIIEYLP